MNRIVLATIVLLVPPATATHAQGAPPQTATDITAADVQAVLAAPTGGADRQMAVVDIGKYNLSVGVLHRGKTTPGAPVGAINHEHVTEVYYVISGSGTLLTGGTVDNVKPLPADGEIVKIAVGPSNQGMFRAAAQSRKVGPGDIIIIPAGVYHGFTEIADHVDYVSIRPDPDHVLPAGYVHPLLKK
jgi:mannose-6-phosphate isomerase-like protein (cupin superfamily)